MTENNEPNRYCLRVGKWGMYVHDLNTGTDIDMESVRDLLNTRAAPESPTDIDFSPESDLYLVYMKGVADGKRSIKELPADNAAALEAFDDEYLQEAYDMAIAGMENDTVFDDDDFDIITALANGTKAWLNRAVLQQPTDSELVEALEQALRDLEKGDILQTEWDLKEALAKHKAKVQS